MALPLVFISYRQLDDAQRLRVRDFAERLRGCGIEVVLDQFYKDKRPGGPPEGWPKWSSDQAIHAEKVLIIGSEAWFRCFDGKEQPGTGLGAACEAGNLRQRIYDLGGEQYIIRVAYFDDTDVSALSFDLKRYHRFNVARDFDDLVAWVTGEPFVLNGGTETKPRTLRFWSTRESIDKGEITVLAIIETVLAVALLVILTAQLNLYAILAKVCVLAPLALLRTSRSVELGIRFAKLIWTDIPSWHFLPKFSVALAFGVASYFCWQFALPKSTHIPLFLWGTYFVAAIKWVEFLVIRVTATVLGVCSSPIESLIAIPSNWRRLVLAEDSHHCPTYLPGITNGPLEKLINVSEKFGPEPDLSAGSLWRWFNMFFEYAEFIFLYVFASAFRWSVKATCLIYLPLVWIANKAQYSPRTSVKAMLHDYLVDDIQRVRRWLAFLSVSALTMKVAVWWHLDEARAWAHEHLPLWALKVVHDWRHYLDPQHVPWWQITPAINGALAVGLFVYARRVLNLKDHVPADALVLRNWRIVNVLSSALSIYTILCVLLLTWKAGDLMGTMQKLRQMFDHRVVP